MKLEDFGYTEKLEKLRIENGLGDHATGRIISEHKERYIVVTEKGELEAEVTGNLRFSSHNREDFPAVGDWVALTLNDPGLCIIHKILPRSSMIYRKHVSLAGEKQLIATNIDYALLVQAVDRDFNINRLERYLTICYTSNVSPIIVLTKIDLIKGPELLKILENLKARISNVPIFALSSISQEGYDKIKTVIEKGRTYCLLGSSGAGKSTLLNTLSGKTIMRTNSISGSTNKGKHVTSHRQLIVLDNGGIIIDNPGLREVGIADATPGLEITFEVIKKLARKCRFKNCTHTHEIGCAILEALEKGIIEKDSYDNFLKMERESTHFESTIAEKRKKDKEFGKRLKNYKKNLNKK